MEQMGRNEMTHMFSRVRQMSTPGAKLLSTIAVFTGPPNGPVLLCTLSLSSVVVCDARGQSAAAARRDSTVTSR